VKPYLSGMQRAAILSSAASLVPPNYSTFSHKRHDFQKKKLLNIKCVFLFSLRLLFETVLILRRIQLQIVTNVKTSSCKLFLLDFNQNLVFSIYFRKNIKFYKYPSSGSRVVPCGGQTDMTKIIVAFCNFANAPKIYRLFFMRECL
jgi:transglutaminase/protease-like cytokinesis protein 3